MRANNLQTRLERRELYSQNIAVDGRRIKKKPDLSQNSDVAAKSRLLGMIHLMERLEKMEETVKHSRWVMAYALVIYEAWAAKKGFPQSLIVTQKEVLGISAQLHDIGKISVPEAILNKAGMLSLEEYEAMKDHSLSGAQWLLEDLSELEKDVAEVALYHHEHWDGSGYPTGCRGTDIPVFARVIAVADVYDALTSYRVYKDAWQEADVLKTLQTDAGTYFDPEVVDAFFWCLGTIRVLTRLCRDISTQSQTIFFSQRVYV